MKNLRSASHLFITTVISFSIAGQAAFANIIPPTAPAAATSASMAGETRAILDKAAFIAFQGVSAMQKIQALPMDNLTSELLRNYMASMVYIPQAIALPSDEEALDEPWMASASGTTREDGLVVPDIGPDEGHEIDIDPVDKVAQQFLKFLKPVQNALVTSGFGWRWGRPHQGIDMAAPIGTPIMSAEAGKVVYTGWKSGYGNFVAVDHGHGYQTHYAHCSKILVRKGQTVKKGQTIAKVGSTGYSTGPHLHFEVVTNGVHRNPAKFLNRRLTVVNAEVAPDSH